MLAYVAVIRCLPAEFEAGLARLFAIGRVRGGWQRILAIRQGESEAERAVRAQLDLAVADGHRRIRFRGPVNNQLGVDVEPEAAPARYAAQGTGKARNT